MSLTPRESVVHEDAAAGEDHTPSDVFDLANAIFVECKQEGPPLSSLNTAVWLYREVLDQRRSPHPRRCESLNNLADALVVNFGKTGHHPDLDEALLLYSEAFDPRRNASVEDTTETHCQAQLGSDQTIEQDVDDANPDEEASNMADLATATLKQHNEACQLSSLNTAISLYREALDLWPAPHPDRITSIDRLAVALTARFRHTNQLPDLDEGISLNRDVLLRRDVAHPERPGALNGLCATLLTRFGQTGQQSDLREAVMLRGEALMLELNDAVGAMEIYDEPRFNDTESITQPQEALDLFDFSDTIFEQFEQSGELSDLDTVISLRRESLLLHRESLFLRNRLGSILWIGLGNLATALQMRFERTGELPDLDEAISLHREGLTLLPPWDPNRLFPLSHLTSDLAKRSELTGQLQELDEAILLYREALVIGCVPHPKRPILLQGAVKALLARFKTSGELDDLNEAVSLCREVLILYPTPDSDRLDALRLLASSLVSRFDWTGELSDIDEVVSLHREVLVLLPAPHPDRWRSLNTFATALSLRFGWTDQISDVDEIVSHYREALVLLPLSHPDRWALLNDLADTLGTRFQKVGQLSDLNESISFSREALILCPAPHPDRARSLDNLGRRVGTRYEHTGQLSDLGEEVMLQREALSLRPASDPNRLRSLAHLGNALERQFNKTGQLLDLDEAISLYCEARDMTMPAAQRSVLLNNLGTALQGRFEQTGEQRDQDEAVSVLRNALSLQPVSDPNRWMSLNNLATAVQTQFDQTGQLSYLDEVVSFQREALLLVPLPNRSIGLHNLASSLMRRFRLAGQLVDLDDGIALLRETLVLRPAPHPKRWTSLNNLAGALYRRFERTMQDLDLDDAVLLLREVLKLLPTPHPDRHMSLNLLGIILSARSKRAELTDLHEAISHHREALAICAAPHPGRPVILSGLGGAVQQLFEETGELTHLTEAISLYREALTMVPAPHPHRWGSLNCLAIALEMRFRKTAQLPDLEEAIAANREAFQGLSPEHPDCTTIARNLGSHLMLMYSQTQQLQDLDEAMVLFRAAVQCGSGPMLQRFLTARIWASHADTKHESSLEAYQSAIELLPSLAMLDLDLQSRQEALVSSNIDGLARDAAACALRSCQVNKAVELLEAGRSVFWSQALQLRTPLEKIQLVAPELAERLRRISHALEEGSRRDATRNLSDTPEKASSIEQDAAYYRRLNVEWLETLKDVRELEGFEDFLRAKPLAALQKAAANGPVVVLNACRSGCAALIMNLSSVEHIPLPALHAPILERLCKLMRAATRPGVSNFPLSASTHMQVQDLIEMMPTLPCALYRELRQGKKAPIASISSDKVFHFVLASLWSLVVQPVISSLHLTRSESPPRLWWCPTGPFAFLPIHAAGIYDTMNSESVSDYIISSYTPTLDTLLAPKPLIDIPFKMMVTIQPKALPCTLIEMCKIEDHVSSECLLRLGIPNVPASVNRVFSELPTVSIAHFACHGEQNMKNPLESALILDDGPLKVSRLIQQSMPNASLAFLSACQTAVGDENLPDEAFHLAGTMLFVGYRGVVATMWSIADSDGPKVADTFYSHLFKKQRSTAMDALQPHPDTTEAARALHIAVAKLRAEKSSFNRWVPFIHLGL